MTGYSLDPEVAAFVRRTDACYPEASGTATVSESRATYDRMCRVFAAPHPPGLTVTEGVLPARLPTGAVPWRRYVPTAAETGCTALYFHGGGFVVGGLDSHDSVCAELSAGARIAVLAVDYRLSPEHCYPAALDDAEAAFDWLAGQRVVVAGDSAGGTLAAALCLRLRRRGKKMPVGQLLIYPALHPDASRAADTWRAIVPMLTAADVLAYRRLYTGRADPDVAADPELAPLAAADLSGLPPAGIFAADIDPLAEDAVDYAAGLRAAGVRTSLDRGEGLVHGDLRGRHDSRRIAAAFAAIVARLRALASDQELPGGASMSA